MKKFFSLCAVALVSFSLVGCEAADSTVDSAVDTANETIDSAADGKGADMAKDGVSAAGDAVKSDK